METMKQWKCCPKRLFELADGFIQELHVADLAVLKFCLMALGILVGICLPRKTKRTFFFGSLMVFLITFLYLVTRWGIFIGKSDREIPEAYTE